MTRADEPESTSGDQPSVADPPDIAARNQSSDPTTVDGGAQPAPTSAASDGSQAGATSNEELEALRDRYLRLAAEYDNYRKRTDRERGEGRDRAQAQLVERLIEPLDDLQRVARLDPTTTTMETLLEGIRLVERKLSRALEAAGLEIVEAGGQPFNPEYHEALMTAPTADADEDDTVGEVFQPGYRFRGTLLRPARVQVRKHGG
jgi:molecular chaperone GrpE